MKALILLGLQNDFYSFGNMEIPMSCDLSAIANFLMPKFDFVVALKINYPANHYIFAANHLFRQPGKTMKINGKDCILQPMHCVEGSFGSEFPSDLNIRGIDKILQLGTYKDINIKSAFFDENSISTGLDKILKEQTIKEVYLMGTHNNLLKNTSNDALQLGFNTFIIKDAVPDSFLKQEQCVGVFNLKHDNI